MMSTCTAHAASNMASGVFPRPFKSSRMNKNISTNDAKIGIGTLGKLFSNLNFSNYIVLKQDVDDLKPVLGLAHFTFNAS